MQNTMSSTEQLSPQRPTGQRAYHAPVVQEFGNIRAMTQSKGKFGKGDGAPGGGNSNNKTNAF